MFGGVALKFVALVLLACMSLFAFIVFRNGVLFQQRSEVGCM